MRAFWRLNVYRKAPTPTTIFHVIEREEEEGYITRYPANEHKLFQSLSTKVYINGEKHHAALSGAWRGIEFVACKDP